MFFKSSLSKPSTCFMDGFASISRHMFHGRICFLKKKSLDNAHVSLCFSEDIQTTQQLTMILSQLLKPSLNLLLCSKKELKSHCLVHRPFMSFFRSSLNLLRPGRALHAKASVFLKPRISPFWGPLSTQSHCTVQRSFY